MAYVIAQMSDIHIGGSTPGSGERFSEAIAEVNSMARQPDLVMMTGDLTEHGSSEEWTEFNERVESLTAPWEAIAGNHDREIEELRGHRTLHTGPLRLVLLDTSSDVFGADDAEWLETELSASSEQTVVAIHQPPFETGIWWMDCVGLTGAEGFEEVIRRHPQVMQVLSGHVHRPIHTNWAGCSIFVCPSTSVAVAGDLDPDHDPSETAEGPMIGLHAYTAKGVVSHVVPVGSAAVRNSISEVAPDFVRWARGRNEDRPTLFA